MPGDDASGIEMLLREHFAKTDKQLAEFRRGIEGIRAEIRAIKNDMEHIRRDVGFLHDWTLWLLMVAVTLLALPQIKSLIGAIFEGVSEIVRAFRKE